MQEYRLVMQYKNSEGRFINNDVIACGKIKALKEMLDLGLRHNDQIEILQRIQDSILNKQSEYLKEDTMTVLNVAINYTRTVSINVHLIRFLQITR